MRESLDTRDWQRAIRKLAEMENPRKPDDGLRPCAHPGCDEHVETGRCAKHRREVSAAIVAFHTATQDLGEGTRRNYRRVLRFLEEFTAARGIEMVDPVDLETLNAFRATRPVSARTWTKELQVLRYFFRQCLDNEWIERNWAVKVSMPRNLKPAPREPYEPNEIVKILAACDTMGRYPYERLRARDGPVAALYRTPDQRRCHARKEPDPGRRDLSPDS